MRAILPLLFVGALLASSSLPVHAAEKPAFDSRLVGEWRSTGKGDPDPGDRFVVKANGDITFRGKEDSESYEGRIQKTDEKADPPALDVVITASSHEEAVGKVVRAIYRLEGERLELASRGPGEGERPKKFDEEKVRRFAFTRSPASGGGAASAAESKPAKAE